MSNSGRGYGCLVFFVFIAIVMVIQFLINSCVGRSSQDNTFDQQKRDGVRREILIEKGFDPKLVNEAYPKK